MTGLAHTRLELRVLGGFELRRGGEVVRQWPRAGPRQLLKRLAVSERQAMSAEALADSFWPNDESDRLTKRLHHLVHLLRKTLHPGPAGPHPDDAFEPCLRSDDGVVRLVTGEALWIDLVEFEQQLAASRSGSESEGPLEQALALYRGRLLGEEAEEDWLAPRRAQVEGRFVAAAHRLAALQMQQGRLQAATETLNKLLVQAPSDEAAHRELIALYGRLGQAEDVQRQFNECTVVLQRELDAEPEAATRTAYQAAQEAAQKSAQEAAQALSAAVPATRVDAQPSSPDIPKVNMSACWTVPAPLVQLLGRDQAVNSALQQLSDGVRLLTLVGTGGVGKTQLAIRIAHEVQQAYPQGACFVPLAEAQPGDLYPAIARAMGLKLPRHEEPKVTVQRALERSRMLLIIDNFEHMLSEVAELPLLLQHSAGLALLVTSRIRLNLAMETCVTVPPLTVDRSGTELPEALRLFIDCAHRIRPELVLRDGEIEEALAITRCLGGLPLAIELAAARLPLFNLNELRRAVESSFHVLTGGGADRPLRQRSLGQSFGWSYGLLSRDEQSLLLMLSLCDASFDHHDAQGLGGANAADPGLELQALVEAGFVIRSRARSGDPGPMGDARFEIAMAIREFARQELQRRAGRAELQSRFTDHFVRMADWLDAATDAGDPNQVRRAMSEFANQSPNFFAALNVAHAADQPAEVCRLVASLARMWGYSGMWHEPNRWIDRASKYVDAADLKYRARMMYNLGIYWERHGFAEQALVAAKKAVLFAEEADQPSVLAFALRTTGLLAARNGRVQLEEVSSLLRRARPLAARLDDISLKWLIINDQAMIHFARGKLKRAWAMLAACDRQLERAGDEFSRGRIHLNLARVLAYNGKPHEVQASVEQAFARWQGTVPSALAELHLWSGWFYCCQMDVSRARDMAHLAHEVMIDGGSEYLQASMRWLEGQIATLTNEWAKALELLRSAVSDEPRDANPWIALDAQIWCFRSAMHMGADEIAAKALSCAVSSRLRWPRDHPRMLEAAAAWFIHHGREDVAALAWLQASAIRSRNGIVRFPVDGALSEQTCTRLAQSLGPNWPSEWQHKTSAVDGDDPLAWLVSAISAPGTRGAQAAANDGRAATRKERTLGLCD
jgi:predicted ATPase/DNA-binding SARP family transcriptional activator